MNSEYPVVLIIRDGWGENHNHLHNSFNAIRLAKTPVSQNLKEQWPHTGILACGLDVGLPEGVMGNSEVGHQNIGAGRVVNQEIVRISKAIANGELNSNSVLNKAFDFSKSNQGALHLMGLVSDAGVHSHLSHLYGLLKLAKESGIQKAFIHAFTDGRDTLPQSSLEFIRQIKDECKKVGLGQIASVCGRFWSMDRDQRWDRVEKAYNCLIGKTAEYQFQSAKEAIQHYYDNPLDSSRKGDEFVIPAWIVGKDNKPIGPIKDGDSVIFFNFRGDRPRELTHAFIDEDFNAFFRSPRKQIYYATLTEYQAGLCNNVIFTRPAKMKNILGQVVSEKGFKQFRCAETEKYPHVTFFFNDYREEPFPGEDRALIPSPKDVPTYDLKPAMSADEVCKATKAAIESKTYGLIVVNFANADMVGHTGSVDATTKAVETVDACLGTLLDAIDKAGGVAVITADHGNADQLWIPEKNSPHTQHTLNPVEVIIYGKGFKSQKLRQEGRLADLAPTILQLMGLKQLPEMTGSSLIAQK